MRSSTVDHRSMYLIHGSVRNIKKNRAKNQQQQTRYARYELFEVMFVSLGADLNVFAFKYNDDDDDGDEHTLFVWLLEHRVYLFDCLLLSPAL